MAVSQTCAAGLALLRRGVEVIKFSTKGQPAVTLVRLSDDEKLLSWQAHGLGKLKRRNDKRVLEVKGIERVDVGRESASFKSAKPKARGAEHLSLSIVMRPSYACDGRQSLDLCCADEESFGLLVAALRVLAVRRFEAAKVSAEKARPWGAGLPAIPAQHREDGAESTTPSAQAHQSVNGRGPQGHQGVNSPSSVNTPSAPPALARGGSSTDEARSVVSEEDAPEASTHLLPTSTADAEAAARRIAELERQCNALLEAAAADDHSAAVSAADSLDALAAEAAVGSNLAADDEASAVDAATSVPSPAPPPPTPPTPTPPATSDATVAADGESAADDDDDVLEVEIAVRWSEVEQGGGGQGGGGGGWQLEDEECAANIEHEASTTAAAPAGGHAAPSSTDAGMFDPDTAAEVDDDASGAANELFRRASYEGKLFGAATATAGTATAGGSACVGAEAAADALFGALDDEDLDPLSSDDEDDANGMACPPRTAAAVTNPFEVSDTARDASALDAAADLFDGLDVSDVAAEDHGQNPFGQVPPARPTMATTGRANARPNPFESVRGTSGAASNPFADGGPPTRETAAEKAERLMREIDDI